ncbi:MAG TPA: TolC family protein [Chitinophagaceae bacterium]|nr:TolC family protein [Chitinophagaceae bacterium]
MNKFLLSLMLLAVYRAPAQPVVTLEQAIATALQNNYDIQLSRNDSLVAALNYSYRNAAFLPSLNGNLGTTWNVNNQHQTLADGTKRASSGVRSNNIAGSLALNWTLFDGLRMFATRDKAAQILQLGELTVRNQVVNTVANVINTYYNIVRQKQQLRAVMEQMSIDEERVKLAQYKLDIGVGIKPDLLQSKVDLNAQKAARLEQETLIAKLKEQLNQVMNVQANSEYEVSDSIPIRTDLTLQDILEGASKTNPALQIAQKNIDISRLTLKETRAGLFPVIALNSGYSYSRVNNKTVVNPFFPLFSQSSGLNYGLTATVPIFNNFNTRRLIRQARLNINYESLVYQSQQSLLNLGILNAYKDYEQQKKALLLEEENILLAKENVSIVLETYRLGAATLLQLKDAQNSLEDAYNRLIAARYNTKLAETELLRLKGELGK